MLNIIKPDDWHVHLRQDAMLARVAHYTAKQFGRAIVMPNLRPPIVTTKQAEQYAKDIMSVLDDGFDFKPLMTLYLTDNTDPDDVFKGYDSGIVAAVKYYPAGATTNSQDGVTDIRKCHRVFETMQKTGMPLLIHGEVTTPRIDIFDREVIFIEQVLEPLRRDFPDLKIVLEHITTQDAVQYVRDGHKQTKNLAATITAHHLYINRNDMLVGGIQPHHYCLPVAKRETHRLALRRAATSGDECFFLGTDSAPHAISAKQSDCGCAGIFTAPYAIELYAQVFDEENKLDHLEAFASLNGPKFYGLKPNKTRITLKRQSQQIPGELAGHIKPFAPKQGVNWVLGVRD